MTVGVEYNDDDESAHTHPLPTLPPASLQSLSPPPPTYVDFY